VIALHIKNEDGFDVYITLLKR